MKPYIFSGILLLVCRILPGQNLPFQGKVSFVSEAPLELIKAESQKLQGVIDPATKSFAFSVTLKSFDGFNSALQKEHFHENYMESETYPTLHYTGKLLDEIPFQTDGVYECRSKGKFFIHGVSKEKIIKNKVTVKGNKIMVESQFNILLADYNIAIPKIVHKKIAEEIKVIVSAQAIKS